MVLINFNMFENKPLSNVVTLALLHILIFIFCCIFRFTMDELQISCSSVALFSCLGSKDDTRDLFTYLRYDFESISQIPEGDLLVVPGPYCIPLM